MRIQPCLAGLRAHVSPVPATAVDDGAGAAARLLHGVGGGTVDAHFDNRFALVGGDGLGRPGIAASCIAQRGRRVVQFHGHAVDALDTVPGILQPLTRPGQRAIRHGGADFQRPGRFGSG